MSTLPLITACNVDLAQSGTISVYTLPFRLNIPKTIVLPYAPRPLLPLTCLAPKKLSSTSITPLKGDSDSQYVAICSLINRKYRLTVLRLSSVNSVICFAFKSRLKSLISWLIFRLGIRVRYKTFVTIVTTKIAKFLNFVN